MQYKELYNIVDDTADILANLKNGQRALSSDEYSWIVRNSIGEYVFFPPNKKYTNGVGYEFLNAEFLDLTCSLLNTSGLNDPYLTVPLAISDLSNPSLVGFTEASLVGCLNEVMSIATGGLSNYWEQDGITVTPTTASIVKLNMINTDLEDSPLPIAEAGDTSIAYTSLYKAINDLTTQVDLANEPRDILYYVNLGVGNERMKAEDTLISFKRQLWSTDGSTIDSTYKRHMRISDYWAFDTDTNNNLFIRTLTNKSLNIGLDCTEVKFSSTVNKFYIDAAFTDVKYAYKPASLYYDATGSPYLTSNATHLDIITYLDFSTTTIYMKFAGWTLNKTSSTIGLLVDSLSGLGKSLHLGSAITAVNANDFIDQITLSARLIYIQNNTDNFELFDLLSNLEYPDQLFYQGNPSYQRAYATLESVVFTGSLSHYSFKYEAYVDGVSRDTAHTIGDWCIALGGASAGSYYKDFYIIANNAIDNTDAYMVLGTPSNASTAAMVINSIRMFATHIYIQKTVGGTTWDLFDIVGGSIYPDKLYYQNNLAQIKASCIVTGIDINGEIDMQTGTTDGADVRLAKMKNWYFRYNTLNLALEASGSASLYLGALRSISTYANFIPAVHLRAQQVFIENGNITLDLFTLASGTSGFGKGTRVYQLTSNITLNSGVELKVSYNTEVYDDDNCYTAGTFTAKSAKIHAISGSARISVSAGGHSLLQIRLYKGSTCIAENTIEFQQAASLGIAVSSFVKLAINDTVEVRLYQNSGFAATILADLATEFNVAY